MIPPSVKPNSGLLSGVSCSIEPIRRSGLAGPSMVASKESFSVTGHGGTPEERPDTYAKSDVVSRIKNITAPVLLMHGELDRRVPIQNFEHAVTEFERLGKSVEVKTYPEEGHGFRNPDNRVDMYTRLEAFFERHLGSCTAS